MVNALSLLSFVALVSLSVDAASYHRGLQRAHSRPISRSRYTRVSSDRLNTPASPVKRRSVAKRCKTRGASTSTVLPSSTLEASMSSLSPTTTHHASTSAAVKPSSAASEPSSSSSSSHTAAATTSSKVQSSAAAAPINVGNGPSTAAESTSAEPATTKAAEPTTTKVSTTKAAEPTTTEPAPTSTKKAATSTSHSMAAAATTAASSSSSGSSSLLSGTKSGQGTFYSTGLNACGSTDQDTDYIAAVSHILFDEYPGYDGANPNNNPICNKKVTAVRNGKSVTVAITDRCEGCAEWDLDFSPTAFDQLASADLGRVDITWTWN